MHYQLRHGSNTKNSLHTYLNWNNFLPSGSAVNKYVTHLSYGNEYNSNPISLTKKVNI